MRCPIPVFSRPAVEAPSLAERFMQALRLQRKGQLDLAFEAYQSILRDHPHHAGSHMNAGIVLVLSGDSTRALPSLARAVELEPDNADAHFNHARALSALARHVEALEELEKARSLAPSDVQTLQEVCRTQLTLGRFDAFFEAVAAGLDLAPQNPALYLMKAEAFLQKGDHGRATDLLNLLLHNDPSLEGALALLADAYIQTHRHDKAVACVKRALLKNPDSAQLHKKLGICYSLRGDRDLARGELARARELDPSIIVTLDDGGPAHEEKPESWDALRFQGYILARTEYYARTGAWRSAIAEFLLLARKYQDRPIIWQELASAYQNAGEYRRAYALYRKVLAMEPENLEVQLQLSRLALTIGRIAEARRYSEQTAASYPDVSEVAEIQGQIALEAGDLPRAREAFRRAIERSPANLDALLGLGSCYLRGGELPQARDTLEQANKAFPRGIRIALELAGVHVLLGQRVAAIKLLRDTKLLVAASGAFLKRSSAQKAPAQEPIAPTAPSDGRRVSGSPLELLHRLGALYLESGWPKKARAEWRELLDLWDGDLHDALPVFEALVFFREIREGLRLIRTYLKRHASTPELDFLSMFCHVLQRDQTKFWISWQRVWKEQPDLMDTRAHFFKAVLSRADVHFLLSQMPRTLALFSGFPETMQRIAGLEEYLSRIQAMEVVTELFP